MDISQIPIKINQTNNSDGGKQKISSQGDGSPSFSGHVLAIVNHLNKSGKDDEQSASKNSSKDLGNSTDNKDISSDDMPQLSSLLAALAGVFNPFNPKQESSPEKNPSENNQKGSADIIVTLSSLVQKLEGAIQDPSQMGNHQIIKLKQLIVDLQAKTENGTELPNDFDVKIKNILDELKTVNAEPVKGTPAETLKINDNNVTASISKLSLDKNQVLIPGIPIQRGVVQLQNNFAKNAPLQKKGDQSRLEGTMLNANQPFQAAVLNNPSKAGLSSPVLAVSDFVPEMSEWMDRFMNIIHGQSGSTEAKFSLFPEHLGPIEIKITSQHGEVSAQIVTGTTMAKEALEGQLPQLREALQQQGIQVQKLDIVQQPEGTNSSYLSFSQSGYSSSQEQKQFQSARGGPKKQDAENQFDLESVPSAIPYSGTPHNLTSRIDFTA